MLAQAVARDADEPGERRASGRVVGCAAAERSRERLARHVLRIGARADPVGHVGVDPLDQLLGVGERIAAAHQHPSQIDVGFMVAILAGVRVPR